jgi:hypothetical protein
MDSNAGSISAKLTAGDFLNFKVCRVEVLPPPSPAWASVSSAMTSFQKIQVHLLGMSSTQTDAICAVGI